MRKTVTLDGDVAARLEQLQRERGTTFKEVLNETLRAGLAGEQMARPYRLPTFRMGVRPGVNLDRAFHLDAALDDEEILRKVELRE